MSLSTTQFQGQAIMATTGEQSCRLNSCLCHSICVPSVFSGQISAEIGATQTLIMLEL